MLLHSGLNLFVLVASTGVACPNKVRVSCRSTAHRFSQVYLFVPLRSVPMSNAYRKPSYLTADIGDSGSHRSAGSATSTPPARSAVAQKASFPSSKSAKAINEAEHFSEMLSAREQLKLQSLERLFERLEKQKSAAAKPSPSSAATAAASKDEVTAARPIKFAATKPAPISLGGGPKMAPSVAPAVPRAMAKSKAQRSAGFPATSDADAETVVTAAAAAVPDLFLDVPRRSTRKILEESVALAGGVNLAHADSDGSSSSSANTGISTDSSGSEVDDQAGKATGLSSILGSVKRKAADRSSDAIGGSRKVIKKVRTPIGSGIAQSHTAAFATSAVLSDRKPTPRVPTVSDPTVVKLEAMQGESLMVCVKRLSPCVLWFFPHRHYRFAVAVVHASSCF